MIIILKRTSWGSYKKRPTDYHTKSVQLIAIQNKPTDYYTTANDYHTKRVQLITIQNRQQLMIIIQKGTNWLSYKRDQLIYIYKRPTDFKALISPLSVSKHTISPSENFGYYISVYFLCTNPGLVIGTALTPKRGVEDVYTQR